MSVNTLSKTESLSRFVEALQARTTVARDTSGQDEQFGRSLAQAMTRDLGPDIAGLASFGFESATRTEIGAWHAEQSPNAICIRCAGGEAQEMPSVLASMETQIVRDVATLLLGGTLSAGGEKAEKPLTRIEQSICDMLWRDLIVAVGKQTRHEMGLPAVRKPAEIDLAGVKDEKALVLRFAVKVGGREGTMEMALPVRLLPEGFAAAAPAGKPDAVSATTQPDQGAPRFGGLKVEATIRLSGGTLTYRQIEELTEGSIIALPDAAFANCILQVGNEVMATARVGKSGNQYCIRVNDEPAAG